MASDGCGSSNDYFTLQTSVSGSYYAVDFKDNTVSFEARTASGGTTRQLVKKDNAITKIEILNSGGTTVYSATAENSTVVLIPKEILSAGEYNAYSVRRMPVIRHSPHGVAVDILTHTIPQRHILSLEEKVGLLTMK